MTKTIKDFQEDKIVLKDLMEAYIDIKIKIDTTLSEYGVEPGLDMMVLSGLLSNDERLMDFMLTHDNEMRGR